MGGEKTSGQRSRGTEGLEARVSRGISPQRRIGDDRGAHCRKALLCIDSDETVLGLARRLHGRNVIPTLAFGLAESLDCLREESYRVVVLDLDSCDGDVREMRAAAQDAAVLLVGDAPPGLRDVMDDHLPRGVDVSELFHRAMTLVELSRPVKLPRPLRWGRLELDVGRRIASWNGRPLELTTLQFRIMEVLVLAAGSVVTPAQLSRRVWGEESFEDRDRVVAHIRRIRRLIEPDPSRPRFLLAVRGEGFRLADDVDEVAERVVSIR